MQKLASFEAVTLYFPHFGTIKLWLGFTHSKVYTKPVYTEVKQD
jgi:hypothetical protein